MVFGPFIVLCTVFTAIGFAQSNLPWAFGVVAGLTGSVILTVIFILAWLNYRPKQ